MSAAETRELQDACNRILRRLQATKNQSLPCVLCGVFVYGGEAKLTDHVEQRHGISLCPFSNVVDSDGFTGCLKERLGLPGSLRCPVCLEGVGQASDLEALRAHASNTGHSAWNGHTIPELSPFCLPAHAGSAGVDRCSSDDDLDDDDDKHKGRNDVDAEGAEEALLGSDDDDWNDPCVCLYCADVSEACLEHMAAAHGFDLRAATRNHDDVKDEYDIIRLVNQVRRAVKDGTCPYASGSTADVRPCEFTGTLEEHLQQYPKHRLPQRVWRDSDEALLPVLPGDALLSLVVTAGEGFLREEEADSDFPMAPTLQEVAAHGIAMDRALAAKPTATKK